MDTDGVPESLLHGDDEHNHPLNDERWKEGSAAHDAFWKQVGALSKLLLKLVKRF